MRAISLRFVAGYMAVGAAIAGWWGVRVRAHGVCDCGRVHMVVQWASAAAVPGGQRRDGQPLLDEPGDVLHRLGNERAVPIVLLISVRHFPVPLLCLCHPQFPAGGGFRGGALPLDKARCLCHRGAKRRGLSASHRLVRARLKFFGLTGGFVVVVAAPHGFVRAVGAEQAWGKWRCRRVAEVEPLCDSSYDFLSLLQQGANEGIGFASGRPRGGAPGQLSHGQVLESSQRLWDGSLGLVGVAGATGVVVHRGGVG